MVLSKEELKNFLNDEAKKEGDHIAIEVKLYPTEQIFWFESPYLEIDDQANKYLKAEGKLMVADYFNPKPGPI